MPRPVPIPPELRSTASGAALRVLLLGATGTVGQATLSALLGQGHHVTCLVRPYGKDAGARPDCFSAEAFAVATFRPCDVTRIASLREEGFKGERFDAVLSCLASRSGAAHDAWAIDYQAHADALCVAMASGVKQFVLLSAICVQKPRLAFQHAKLAFETKLINSGLTYSIVRPTALFKSLSGQIERLRKGKPFLMFGDGELTACKPISDRDLGEYLTRCLLDTTLHNRILPIGGPGPAITPRQQGELLFGLLGREPRFTCLPIGLVNAIAGTLSALGRISPAVAHKAEFARIAQYYATESMLVLDTATGRYDAAATPATGTDDIAQFYARTIKSRQPIELGAHSLFPG